MSTLTVRYSPTLQTKLNAFKDVLLSEFTKATTSALNVDPNGVIVELVPWSGSKPNNAPDVLIRAETSTRRRDHLKNWGEKLLIAWQTAAADQDLPPIRVAVKSYVIDSEWTEL
ncbi:MAG TPA: hypothetical protein VD999_06625 [Vitreimonas sp.]|nr:hypothetical protein [Vitreimonas sp.]